MQSSSAGVRGCSHSCEAQSPSELSLAVRLGVWQTRISLVGMQSRHRGSELAERACSFSRWSSRALPIWQAGSAELLPARRSAVSLSFQRQSNASQTLCDIVRLGREQGGQLPEAPEPDPLLAVLES